MNPKDIEFRQKQFIMKNIIDILRDNRFNYIEDGEVNVSIIEFIICNCKVDSLILRENSEKSELVNSYITAYYDVYRGHGLLRVIKKYIIDEEPLDGLKFLSEYNGKKFSEMYSYIQRRFIDSIINVYIDESFYNENKTDIIDSYIEVINAMR